jgi:heme exporter protein D
MRWSSWSEFWAMGGYALYVWGSFSVTALLMLIEVWQARRHRGEVLQQLQIARELDAQDRSRSASAPSQELS